MRRFSVLIALAVIILSAIVGYTYQLRLAKARSVRANPAPAVERKYEALANEGWRYSKDDPQTNKPMVRVNAKSFEATHDPSTFELQDLGLRLYDKGAVSYTYVESPKALFDERSGTLKSEGPVTIVRNVPLDKNAEDKAEAAKHVRVQTSGVTYETKTGKATTNQPASFLFPDGGGKGVGLEYDPNTKVLHLKSQVSLDWIGKGPAANKMHVETSDLVYKEAEQKIYMTPWAKLQRQSTTIQAQNVLVTLQDGRLHQIDGTSAVGADNREDRRTDYSADKMTALFDENGDLINIVGENNAKVASTQPGSRTTLAANRADLRFAVSSEEINGETRNSSDLHLVLADGHAVAQSDPLPQPGVLLGDTRFLRSEHIELEMRPGGKDVQEIRTSSQAQLEFKPNRPGLPHRIVDASHLRVLYGESSYVDTFLAWNAATHTDKPVPVNKDGKAPSQKPAPSLTWSDELTAKFQPNTNQVATVEQSGNFRYEEGVRKASAKKAFLDQLANRMTLVETARVLDDTGSTVADKIVMNQTTGDMDAEGHVVSTHAPDKNQKPGTSMLDNTKPMQAKADRMVTRENNTEIHYEGHAVMWQNANRITANIIDIDRDAQTLHAKGNVVSELLDNKSDDPGSSTNAPPLKKVSVTTNEALPIFTTVYAPELLYQDDKRVARYTGGVKLTRQKMVITSQELLAFLSPKTPEHQNDSSLDHAFADGSVTVFDAIGSNRTRTGAAEHGEYWTASDKVLLNGGTPQMVDSYKGVTKGQQLTYFNSDDRLLVDGEVKKLAFTQMKKK